MHSKKMLRAFALLLCYLTTATLLAQRVNEKTNSLSKAPSTALDKGHLEFYLRHLYNWSPKFKVEIGDYHTTEIYGFLETKVKVSFQLASQVKVILVSKDGQHILDGASYKIDDNPFRENLKKINMMNLPGFGTEGAPVAIVVYSDFQCPHCAREARMLRTQLLQEYPQDVRVYYQDFPLPKHTWARMAAAAGQCLYDANPTTYWDYFDWIFDVQKSITKRNFSDTLNSFLAAKMIDPIGVFQCTQSEAIEKRIQSAIQEGIILGVRSTPSLFINGRKIVSTNWPQLKQIIDNELAYQAVVHNAGDDCGCSITPKIPSFQ